MCCHMHKEDAGCDFAYNDNFADCESMFRNPAPRISIWAIGSLSIIGSAFVLIWRRIFKEKNVVQTIMLMHLAVADSLNGVYLLTVASVDLLWSGEYYLHDFKWRTGWSCQLTGAIALLSSEVSLMMMSLISADRLKNIVFPYNGTALTQKATHILCFIIWVVGFLIAFFPMFGLAYFDHPYGYHTYYGRSVVCLPLQLTSYKTPGWEYSVAFFIGLNFAFFLFIMVAYTMIFFKSYLSSRRVARQGTAREIQARYKINFRKKRKSSCWAGFLSHHYRLCLLDAHNSHWTQVNLGKVFLFSWRPNCVVSSVCAPDQLGLESHPVYVNNTTGRSQFLVPKI